MTSTRRSRRMKRAVTSMTPTAVKRWSILNKSLPPVQRVKSIHVYDFDNTLFATPLPNKQVWHTSTIGTIQNEDGFVDGGWWHQPRFLEKMGAGVEVEEKRAWDGHWNEKVVELARMSADDAETLSVCLTGRGERRFTDILKRILGSKNLGFDMVCLKPTVSPLGEAIKSTMRFKQAFLKDLITTYNQATEVTIYEDRIMHVQGFREFLQTIPGINGKVVHVTDVESVMDPVVEVEEVQRSVNDHNQAVLDGTAPSGTVPLAIKRLVYYTGYMLNAADAEEMKSLVPGRAENLRVLANNVLIAPRPATKSMLHKVGGVGAKMRWRITGIGSLQDRLWAARVAPVPPDAQIYTDNKTPVIVLATKRNVKPVEVTKISSWGPVPSEYKDWTFVTTVEEKALLRVEEEVANEDVYEASFPKNVLSEDGRKQPLNIHKVFTVGTAAVEGADPHLARPGGKEAFRPRGRDLSPPEESETSQGKDLSPPKEHQDHLSAAAHTPLHETALDETDCAPQEEPTDEQHRALHPTPLLDEILHLNEDPDPHPDQPLLPP
ncbi:hypothetical protein K470DRAFT_275548 [Piedraia hortae CBS 480.64]|uniref:Swiss Army Knife RNA repair protein HAD domain-containing protein n=1 Tax=Piedraia hortae CBS 480.64 TaxID=1314780 RepID=A0A6A7C3W3_9PEZI|nr:hypothetical protein K470DRAFT_275548 [Piedraia hortae CBS 480.64]